MLTLLLMLSLNANTFPKCGDQNINQVWQAQDGTFWWCGGAVGWVAVTVDGGASITPCSVTASGLSCPTDGGFAGILQSKNFVSTYSGPSSASDGGANFDCSSNPGSSSPCFANFQNPFEMCGTTLDAGDPSNANIYLGACNTGTTSCRTAGPLVAVTNCYGTITEKVVWKGMFNGDTHQDGNLTGGENRSDFRMGASVGSLYLEGAQSSGVGTVNVWNMANSGDIADLFSGSGGAGAGPVGWTFTGQYFGQDAGVLNLQATDGGFQRVAASQDVQVAGQLVPTQHGATQLAIESGMDAGTNGALTVAFGTAFAAAPVCFCNHLNATNTSPCNINNTVSPTTALGSFMVDAGGTDKISWLCVGSK